ncbi:MAG: hypothetical protein R3B68_07425 [Phycisphaerales bacterium]
MPKPLFIWAAIGLALAGAIGLAIVVVLRTPGARPAPPAPLRIEILVPRAALTGSPIPYVLSRDGSEGLPTGTESFAVTLEGKSDTGQAVATSWVFSAGFPHGGMTDRTAWADTRREFPPLSMPCTIDIVRFEALDATGMVLWEQAEAVSLSVGDRVEEVATLVPDDPALDRAVLAATAVSIQHEWSQIVLNWTLDSIPSHHEYSWGFRADVTLDGEVIASGRCWRHSWDQGDLYAHRAVVRLPGSPDARIAAMQGRQLRLIISGDPEAALRDDTGGPTIWTGSFDFGLHPDAPNGVVRNP